MGTSALTLRALGSATPWCLCTQTRLRCFLREHAHMRVLSTVLMDSPMFPVQTEDCSAFLWPPCHIGVAFLAHQLVPLLGFSCDRAGGEKCTHAVRAMHPRRASTRMSYVPCPHGRVSYVPCLHTHVWYVPCAHGHESYVLCLHAHVWYVLCVHVHTYAAAFWFCFSAK